MFPVPVKIYGGSADSCVIVWTRQIKGVEEEKKSKGEKRKKQKKKKKANGKTKRTTQ